MASIDLFLESQAGNSCTSPLSLSFYLFSHTWLPPGAQQTYEARNALLLFPFLKYFHPCAQVLEYAQQFLLTMFLGFQCLQDSDS